ncbi:MAG: endolytic transglycosylase MltG [Saccharospirillaceae bacterium]|nr:endolytic transglycosylase MltG [Pseudomonadales bacterium]NRB78655.1 endolytic transglycosylase MltG [Saccharospirillaceae bacterium]
MIKNSRHLSLLLRFTDTPNIKQGEFQIPVNMNVMDVLAIFESGQSVQYSLTFVEGKTVKEFLAQLAQNDQLKHELWEMSESQILKAINTPYLSLEGLIFPDTYFYQKGDSDLDLLKRAYSKLESVLEQQWVNRAKDLPYKNAYEALIMASIVEKETGAAFERPEIAGVFIRRIHKNMRLQTDPTVIYGVGDKYDGNLTRAHLRTYTPYNTYMNKGLPPTPIAASGEEAIFAALNPNEGEALYFVAKGDGTHYFSTTLQEHNNAVNEYQRFKRNRKNYQSAPTQ